MGNPVYISEPCMVCGTDTFMACADCAIDGADKTHVCSKVSCRIEHEKMHPTAFYQRQPAP